MLLVLLCKQSLCRRRRVRVRLETQAQRNVHVDARQEANRRAVQHERIPDGVQWEKQLEVHILD